MSGEAILATKPFFIALTLLLMSNVILMGCSSARTRDSKADLTLSQNKVQPDAAKTTEILKEPQPGFEQEPKAEI